MITWDSYFFAIAKLVSSRSKDRSTKVGCVIVDSDHEIRSTGYNGFPRKFDDDNNDYHARPLKYELTSHAEENAVSGAARKGVSLLGTTAYVTLPPCAPCSRMLVQSGISTVKYLLPEDQGVMDRWKDSFMVSEMIFLEAGVEFKECSFHPSDFVHVFT